MTFLSSLDAKDRKLLLWCVGIAIALAVATGFCCPTRTTTTISTFVLLRWPTRRTRRLRDAARSNYPIERWEQPLTIWPRRPALRLW